jgi:TetR/AcrR family transcriptional regulator, tetracycline repressor protein
VTSEQILRSADSVALQYGIAGLTIRRVCSDLDITAPAIYRHFSSKDRIVYELIDRIIGRTELPRPEQGDWVERLRICFLSIHDEVAPYAGLAAQIGRQFPETPAAERNRIYLIELLAESQIEPEDARKILSSAFVYTWGHLLAADALNVVGDGPEQGGSRSQFLWGLGLLLDAFRREFNP